MKIKDVNIKKVCKVTSALLTIAGLYFTYSKLKQKPEITNKILTKINEL